MHHNVTSPYAMLSQTFRTCLRATKTPAGFALQRFALGESSVQIELTPDELGVWLQSLPPTALLKALEAQGWMGEQHPPSPIADLCICGYARGSGCPCGDLPQGANGPDLAAQGLDALSATSIPATSGNPSFGLLA